MEEKVKSGQVAPRPKILYTSHVANFQKFNRPLMRMMRGRGFEVHYASAGEEEILDADKAFRVDFARSPWRLDKHIRAYRQMKRILAENKYEIIHTHTPVGSVITRLAARRARKNGTRVIYTAHHFQFHRGGSVVDWALFYPIEKIMARWTDLILTISQEDYDFARRRLNAKIVQINGVGVDTDRFKKMPRDERKKKREELGFAEGDAVLIYTAEFIRRKNHEFLLEAMNKMPEKYKLVFAGKGKLLEKMQKRAEELGVAERVKFLGYRNDINEVIGAADAAVSASRHEGLGMNLLEALALGVPIVATRIRGHNEFLLDEQRFEQGDFEEFLRKIENAKLQKPVLPEKFALKNTLRVHLEDVYEDISHN